jgi:hypothetical protein
MSPRDDDKAAISDPDRLDNDSSTASRPSTGNDVDVAATRLDSDSDNHKDTSMPDVDIATVLAAENLNLGSETVLPANITDEDTPMELETVPAAPKQELEAEIETATVAEDAASEAIENNPKAASVSEQDGNDKHKDTSMPDVDLATVLAAGNLNLGSETVLPANITDEDTPMELETVLTVPEPMASEEVENISKTGKADTDAPVEVETVFTPPKQELEAEIEAEIEAATVAEDAASEAIDDTPKAASVSEQDGNDKHKDTSMPDVDLATVLAAGNLNLGSETVLPAKITDEDTPMELKTVPTAPEPVASEEVENSPKTGKDDIDTPVEVETVLTAPEPMASEEVENVSKTGKADTDAPVEVETVFTPPKQELEAEIETATVAEDAASEAIENNPKAASVSEQDGNDTSMALEILPEAPKENTADNIHEAKQGLETAAVRALALEAAKALDSLPEASEQAESAEHRHSPVGDPSGDSQASAIIIDDSEDTSSSCTDICTFYHYLSSRPKLPFTVLVRIPCHRPNSVLQGTVHFHPLFPWAIHPAPPANLLATIKAAERPGGVHKLCHRFLLGWNCDFFHSPLSEVLQLLDKSIAQLYSLEDLAWPRSHGVWHHATWRVGGELLEEALTFGEFLMNAHAMGLAVVTLAVRNRPEDNSGFASMRWEESTGVGTPPEDPNPRTKRYVVPSEAGFNVDR